MTIIALTPPQQRMWFLEQLEPGRPSANLFNGFRISGAIDVEKWNKAIHRVIVGCPILRSKFIQCNDEQAGLEVLTKTEPFKIQVESLIGHNKQEREDSWIQRIPDIAQQPFDLSQPPLFRAHLGQLDQEEFVLFLVMHHIISDGDMTAESLMRQILCALDASYVTQHTENMSTSAKIDTVCELDFWKAYLDDVPQSISLPRFADGHSIHSACPISIPLNLISRIKKFAHEHHVQMFDVFFATYGLLLKSHTAQESILIAWPDPGREATNKEIGYFGQPLPIKFTALSGKSFLDVIRELHETFHAALKHRATPFSEIVSEVAKVRNSRMPLFQTMFDLQPAIPPIEQANLRISPTWWDSKITEYEWSLFLFEDTQGAISGQIEYHSQLYDDDMMRQVATRYLLTLEAIVNEPHSPAYTPLTPQDRETLHRFGHGIELSMPNECSHEWFERQVRMSPEAIAIEFKGEKKTYRELNETANKMARYLKNKGVKSGTIVGLFLERSILTIEALISIWKAGGAFLPLDPAYPAERLEFMLKDSEASHILTQPDLVNRLKTPDDCMILYSNDLMIDAQAEDGENLLLPVSQDQVNYLIYTSGSTGVPKGIAMVHRCLVNIIAWQLHTSPMRQEMRTLQFASLNFDIAFQEMFTTWCAGGTLILLDESTRRDSTALLDYLIAQRINRLFLPFVALQQLALSAQGKSTLDLSLREVLTAGEQLRSTPALRDLFDRLPGCTLQNQYGPSEAHVITSLTLPAKASEWPALPAVGLPLSNTEIILVDSQMNRVPPGAPGEVLTGGVGLAKGYLNRPEQTAISFIDNPFSTLAGDRLYKTGDLGRFLPNGTLEFLRRVDHQVKVRGFRIDLGEIEAKLSQHSLVRETIVVVRGEAASAQLVAYAVPYEKAERNTSLEFSQVNDWQTLWESTYKNSQDSEFNLAGWNSSYTGQAIPDQEMQDWCDQTVTRILALKPDRVLEIGCGAGLLLSRIAPHCSFYAASDFSSAIIDKLQERVRLNDELSHKVELHQSEALDTSMWQASSFDTVIINSVVQLFPSADYAKQVIDNALRMLKPGGKVFVGDVQNYELLEAYHSSVQMHRLSDETFSSVLKAWGKALANEDQLMIAPDFFKKIKNHSPQITRVELNLKQGHYLNELSKFRYDVVLHTDQTYSTNSQEIVTILPFDGQLSIEQISEALNNHAGRTVAIKNIPNVRVQSDIFGLSCLKNESMRQMLSREAFAQYKTIGIDPQACWDIAKKLGVYCHVTWSDDPGCFDAWWSLDGHFCPESSALNKPQHLIANDPLRETRCRKMIDVLMTHLKTGLPEYMVPSHLIILDALPVKTNGKVDFNALPPPDSTQSHHWKKPETETEIKLARLWEETLGISEAGIDDDFFSMGGHSLLAVQLIYRIRQHFLVEIALVQLFEARTIQHLANCVDALLNSRLNDMEEGFL
jgi:amino acid adenylation domain-containing protein